MTSTFKMLIKRETNEVRFIEIEEHGCIYPNHNPKIITDRDYEYIIKELSHPNVLYIAVDKTIGNNGEHYDLYHNIARLCEVSNAKPKAEFTLEYVEFNFIDYSVKILKSWNCASKKYDAESRAYFHMT